MDAEKLMVQESQLVPKPTKNERLARRTEAALAALEKRLLGRLPDVPMVAGLAAQARGALGALAEVLRELPPPRRKGGPIAAGTRVCVREAHRGKYEELLTAEEMAGQLVARDANTSTVTCESPGGTVMFIPRRHLEAA